MQCNNFFILFLLPFPVYDANSFIPGLFSVFSFCLWYKTLRGAIKHAL